MFENDSQGVAFIDADGSFLMPSELRAKIEKMKTQLQELERAEALCDPAVNEGILFLINEGWERKGLGVYIRTISKGNKYYGAFWFRPPTSISSGWQWGYDGQTGANIMKSKETPDFSYVWNDYLNTLFMFGFKQLTITHECEVYTYGTIVDKSMFKNFTADSFLWEIKYK